LAKVNFGVRTDEETRKIGQEGVRGIDLVPEVKGNPILLMGNTESMTIDINGRESDLPNADIRLGVKQIIQGSGKPGESHPPFVSFELDVSRKEVVKKWKLVIFGPEGEVFHQIEEDRIPPQEVLWNGIGSEKIPIETEASYGYSLSVEYKDGSRGESSPGYFSLKPLKALSFSISDFEAESFTLSPRARAFLDEAAEFLRQHPDEKVFMEGHADASGPEDLNFKLSKQRVRAAVDYLIEVQNISPDRFEIGWYGSSKPIWDNSNKHGRALNRRIEMRGEIKPREDLDRREEDRIEPEARINGLPVPVHPDGVFKTEISDPDSDQLTMVVRNKKGGTVETTLDLPTIQFSQPKGAREFRIGEKGEDFEVFGVDTP
ncbi:MAG TPA: OmpA family protein, partial [Nitrospiria bacterium]|nr:OmpA family protein [Nitrospiria bacterium]